MRWAFIAGAAGIGIFVACTGDDPAVVSPPVADGGAPDGSGSSTSSSSGSAADAGNPGSCFGQTFAAPEPVTTTLADAGASTKIEQVRIVGTAAYYARTDTGASPTYIFRSDVGAGSPPTLNGSTVAVAPHVGESDLAPTVASDSSFIVLTHDEVGSRVIWAAPAGGASFSGAGALGVSTGVTDDADPWLAGAPTSRLYFGRGQTDGTAMRIVYADVTPVVGAMPTVGPVVSFTPPCPAAATDDCGRPVVTPDQSMLLFASWTGGLPAKTDYAVHEVALTKDAAGNVTAGTTVTDHPELGARAVSWVSADGCEVLLDDGLANAGVFYAKRAPK